MSEKLFNIVEYAMQKEEEIRQQMIEVVRAAAKEDGALMANRASIAQRNEAMQRHAAEIDKLFATAGEDEEG